MVDEELRLWWLWDAVINSISLSTHSHTDRLNATARRVGHILQLFRDSSRGAHLAGVTVSVLAGLLQRSATAGVKRLSVCNVSVSERGARWLPPTGTAITDAAAALPCFTCDATMSAPWPGRWVRGKNTEYLGCSDKVFADAISIESNASYNNLCIYISKLLSVQWVKKVGH